MTKSIFATLQIIRPFSDTKTSIRFRKTRSIKTEHLKSVFTKSKMIFEKPITISQISFSKKQLVQDHIPYVRR